MVVVGFDVSKHELVGARSDRSRQNKQLYRIDNEPEAISGFLRELRQKHPRAEIACESTGPYHYTLLRCCTGAGVPLRIINPILTKQFIKTTVRKTKTDPSDALLIAWLALRKEGYYADEGTISQAKALVRTAAKCRKQAKSLELSARHLEEVSGDETESVLSGSIENLYRDAEELEARAGTLIDGHLLELLKSLPGVGARLATVIAAEVGSFRRFPSADALVACMGLDPQVRQSGTTLKRNGRLTKRGSPHLRRAMFLAASVARQCDDEFHAYYERKKAEGRSYTEAVVATARKLTRCMYAVCTKEEPYRKKLKA